MPHLLDEARGDFLDRQDEIDAAGCRGATRHTVERRGFGRLREGQAAGFLDGFEPERAIAAAAGQNDADAVFALVLRERPEEIVDGHAAAARGRRMQRAARDAERRIGRNDIDVVRLDLRAIGGLDDRHPGIGPEQVDHRTLVMRIEVRHFYRKPVRLVGEYVRGTYRARICVDDVSRDGVGFRTEHPHTLRVNDQITVHFRLDDPQHSEVSALAVVRRVEGMCVGAEFLDVGAYTATNRILGFYLLA